MKNFWARFFQSVIPHLEQIPYILWYPIAAAINFVYSLLSYAYSWIDDRFKQSVSDQKRLSRLIRKSVQTVLTGHSNVLSTFWSMRICYLFTFMLQFISLLTTYSGLTYFLKNINPFAPLFLAIVVQGTFYFLINFRGARKREGNWKRWALLITLLLISTTTSFVGISNTIRNPINDMKENYNNYRAYHNKYLNEKTQNTGTFSAEDIQNALYACKNIRSKADSLLNRIKGSVPDHIQNYWAEGGSSVDPETELKRSRILGLQEETESIIHELDMLQKLEAFDARAIFQSVQERSGDFEDNQEYQSFISCLRDYSDAEEKLEDIKKDLEEALQTVYSRDGEKGTIDLEQFSEKRWNEYNIALENEKQLSLDPCDSLINLDDPKILSESSSIWETIGQILSKLELFLVSPELSQAETVRNILNQAMTEKYNLLSEEGRTTLMREYKASQIPSSQLYPFRYLVPEKIDSNWGTSLLAIFLAGMVDLLSLFLALTLIKKRDSVLYAKNHKENVRNREEILEDCYTYLCIKEIMQRKIKEELSAAHIHTEVSKIIEQIMYNFIGKIRVCYIPDSMDGFGYITETDFRSSSFEVYDLFQTLHMVNLIRPITKIELMYLMKSAFPSLEEGDAAAFLESYEKELPDDLLYIVDNRLLMWHNENFSELLQSNLQYEDVVIFGTIK